MSRLIYKIGQIRIYKGDEWWFNDLLKLKARYRTWSGVLRELMRAYNKAGEDK